MDLVRRSVPVMFEESASIAAQLGGIGASALPTTLVPDVQHRVAARFVGAIDRATVRDAIDHGINTEVP